MTTLKYGEVRNMKKKIWSFAIAICLIVVELGGALLVKAEAQGASQAVVETEVSCGIQDTKSKTYLMN